MNIRSNPAEIRVELVVSTATLSIVATWRCPHCGTPQAETSRCWVCSRSPMTCSTCRNFRLGVAARLGFCALDRTREPLAGDEIRACWQPPIAAEPVVGLFAMVEALESAETGGVTGGGGTGSTQSVRPGATPAAPASPAASHSSARPGNRPASWVTAAAHRPGSALPGQRAVNGADATQAPDARPAGRLVAAPTVTPALRLGSRGDARTLREAELARPRRSPASADALPPNPLAASANDEGRGPLEGGTAG